jgi:protein-tyrosine phosphatase
MTRVWERLLVGGVDDAERLAKANPDGITSVITLCSDALRNKAPVINYIQIPIADLQPISLAKFDSVMDTLSENILWGTVLLHCSAGIGRAPVLIAAWMHVVGYKHIESCLQEIAELRPIINPSPVLLKSVKELL